MLSGFGDIGLKSKLFGEESLIKSLEDVVSVDGAWDFKFSRNLKDQEIIQVANLLQLIGEPPMNALDDIRNWRYGDCFTVSNAYNALEVHGLLRFPDKQLWNSKVSSKVSFHVWTLCYREAPTLDILHRAGLVQDSNCLFCGQCAKTNEHLFLHCNVVTSIWSYFLGSFGIKLSFSGDVKTNL
ncbi:uncharacterized protein LOC113295217 [Papaver somniferum]|uniref:uncharacterized protein LOC113295217 n=1 Tax=Papaver somniferum TaxID=3469 RepID=UPI000E702ADD|nr:uncharacterized protein LOC113295217 [Papaver somniferum]